MYFVSRQVSTFTGTRYVELCVGNSDYANPGMLTPKYSGEGQEYHDPREAARVSLAIAQDWTRDAQEPIFVYQGSTYGDTRFFSDEQEEPDSAEQNAKDITTWAARRAESLPHCDQCGAIIDPRGSYYLHDYDERFCSEYCAESRLASLEEDSEEEVD